MTYHRESAVIAASTVAQFLQAEARRASIRSSTSKQSKQSTRSRFSLNALYTRFVGRQFTLAWKRVTVVTRKPERASVIPDGFVWVDQRAKRRSVIMQIA